MYKIVIHYQTGDSFKSYETDDELGEWDLDVAKENLKRIKEHYKAYSDRNNYYSIALRKKAEDELEKHKKERWFVNGVSLGLQNWQYSVNLLENDGSEKEYRCFWVGYFERLLSGKIEAIVPEESDMEFEF